MRKQRKTPGFSVEKKKGKNNKNPTFNPAIFEKAETISVDVLDEITKFPQRVDDFADDLNQGMIDLIKNIQEKGGRKMRKNLTEQKVSSYGERAARWVKQNPFLAVGAAVLLFILIRR